MKKIIRRLVLSVGMMLLHTQAILAQQPTQVSLTDENINLEGWMFMGAGIAICLAGILLFLLNKLFTKNCIKTEKKKVSKKVSKATKPVQPMNQSQVPKKENKNVIKSQVEKPVISKEVESQKALVGNETALRLELIEENNTSQVIRANLIEQVTVGRNSEKCNVVIKDDPTVSGVHCKFYIFANQVYLMDLGSTNGTYVNGTAIQYAVVLKIGDILEIGSKAYRVNWK